MLTNVVRTITRILLLSRASMLHRNCDVQYGIEILSQWPNLASAPLGAVGCLIYFDPVDDS
jgi:hypothetical protein